MKPKLAVFIVLMLLFGTTMIAFKPTYAASTMPSFAFKAPMPTARGQVGVIAGDDGLIYAMGGYNGTYIFDVVEAYNPSTNSWTTKAPLLEPTRGAAVAKGLGGIIYVISGFGAGYLGEVQAYNTTSDTWELKSSIPTPVWLASAATGNDGRIYVMGGHNTLGIEINTLQVYNPDTDTWATGPSMPAPRSQLGVIKAPDGRIYAIGGWDGSSAQNSVFIYDLILEEWTFPIFGLMTPVLEFGLTLGPDGKFYIIGGGTNYGNNALPMFDKVNSYDPNVMLSLEFEGLMPTARKELGAAAALNGKIYIIGGANGTDYVDTNVEMTVLENQPPIAFIDSITPNPAVEGDSVSFVGHGSDPDGSIAAYKWRSSIDGIISTTAFFNTATLNVGTHTIYFSVKDNSGTWSEEVTAIGTVNMPYAEDPTYQKASELQQTVNDLEQQNSDLNAKVDALNNTIDDLNKKIDLMTLELLGAGIITLILVVVAIALVYMTRSKKATSAQAML